MQKDVDLWIVLDAKNVHLATLQSLALVVDIVANVERGSLKYIQFIVIVSNFEQRNPGDTTPDLGDSQSKKKPNIR